MPKIIYLHQYFKTPTQGGATRSFYIADAMHKAGYEVDVITSHNKNQYLCQQLHGFKIHYLPIPYHNSYGVLQRMWAFVKFAFKALKLAQKLKANLVYASSTPLTVGWICFQLYKKNNMPYIFEVRDLWPQAPKELGFLKNPVLLAWLEKLERNIYQNAQAIVALSEPMKEHIGKYTSEKKIFVLPNFSDNILANKYLDNKNTSENKLFKLIYAGSFGYANDYLFLKKLIETIGTVFENQIQLTLMGEGKYAKSIAELSKKHPNIAFKDSVSKFEVYHHVSESDASLITFLPYLVLETSSPNKFFDALACQNICLINFGGWIEDLVIQNNCGFRLSSHNLQVELKQILAKKNDFGEMKKNSKQLAIKYFDQEKLLADLTHLVLKIAPLGK